MQLGSYRIIDHFGSNQGRSKALNGDGLVFPVDAFTEERHYSLKWGKYWYFRCKKVRNSCCFGQDLYK